MEQEKFIYEKPIMDITLFNKQVIVSISNGGEGTGDSATFDEIFGGKQNGSW